MVSDRIRSDKVHAVSLRLQMGVAFRLSMEIFPCKLHNVTSGPCYQSSSHLHSNADTTKYYTNGKLHWVEILEISRDLATPEPVSCLSL